MKRKAGTIFTPVFVVTGIILLIVLITSLMAEYIASYDPLQTDSGAIYAKVFTGNHFLGTDGLGRDLFSRLICSARISIFNAIPIVVFEVVIGVPIGLLCGYYGGFLDSAITRFLKILFINCFISLAVRVGFAFTMVSWLGVSAVWLSLPAGWIISSIYMVIAQRTVIRKELPVGN